MACVSPEFPINPRRVMAVVPAMLALASAPARSAPLAVTGEYALQVKGDLNGDGRSGTSAVVATADPAQTRALLVSTADTESAPGGVVRGAHAVRCASCRFAGDPIVRTTAASSGFDLVLEGRSRERWSQRFHFEWVEASQEWRLRSRNERVADTLGGELFDQERTAPDVSLEQFDASHFVG